MYKLIAFAAVSAALIVLSRASLRVPRSHGFYRLLAAEFVLALLLLNVDQWFVQPLSAHQLVSWFLLTASIVLVISGALTLKAVGKPNGERISDVPIAGIERTTVLVTGGIYRYLRHPMYASGIYGGWGIFFKQPSWPGLIFALGASAFWAIAARAEEGECIRYFGESYRAYARRTRKFVPFLF